MSEQEIEELLIGAQEKEKLLHIGEITSDDKDEKRNEVENICISRAQFMKMLGPDVGEEKKK